MNNFLSCIRAFIALILLTLTACNSPKICREWGFEANMACKNTYNAARIFLDAEKEYDYLEAEIVRTCSGVRFYINNLFMQASPCLEDPSKAKVQILFDCQEEPWIIYPLILRGGQRLLLINEDANFLIESLLEGQSFTIKIDRYELNVISESFCERYQALLNINIAETTGFRYLE